MEGSCIEAKLLQIQSEGLRKDERSESFFIWVGKQDIQRCDIHLREQSSLIDLNNIDFLGRLETFEHDFGYVADTIGLQEYEPEAQLNAVQRNFTLTEEDRLRIADIYMKDFQFFYPGHLSELNISLAGSPTLEAVNR